VAATVNQCQGTLRTQTPQVEQTQADVGIGCASTLNGREAGRQRVVQCWRFAKQFAQVSLTGGANVSAAAMREPVTTTSSISADCAIASVLSSVVAQIAPIARTNIFFFIVFPL
jgi:hypothetical protein